MVLVLGFIINFMVHGNELDNCFYKMLQELIDCSFLEMRCQLKESLILAPNDLNDLEYG